MLMFRIALLAAACGIAATTSALAENWYVISATRNGASIVDVDSRRQEQNAFIVMRRVHPGVRKIRGIPIIGSQFLLEFDCQKSRSRTVEFSLIDLDGRVPAGLRSDRVWEWETIVSGSDEEAAKDFACGGHLPASFGDPYPDFARFESRYLMWLGDENDAEFLR
jgi:hypothetical protein